MGLISFVVTGCARSATTYTAKAIMGSGVYCSHERSFGSRTVWNGLPNIHKDDLDGTWGDSSWWTAAFMSQLPGEVAVLHQVRNPVKNIRSFWTLNLESLKRFIEKHTPEQAFEKQEDELLFYMKHWITWNKLIESRQTTAPGSVYYRYKIEDLRFPSEAALRVAEIVGVSPGAFFDTVHGLKRDINHRGPVSNVTWRDIPESSWKERLRSLATRYGYTEEELVAA